MFSSGKKPSNEPNVLNSSRITSMMREFDTYQRFQPKSSKYEVSSSVPINFDVSKTEEFDSFPANKVRILDSSISAQGMSSPASPVTVLRRKLVEKEVDLQHANATIASLKTAALNFEPGYKKASIEFDKQLDLKSRECDNLKEKLLRLTNHIQMLEKQDETSQANFEEERETLRLDCNRLSEKLKSVQKQKDDLEIEFQATKCDNAATVKQLQNNLMALKLELRLCNDEKAQQDKQHKSIVKQMQEKVVEETLRVKSEQDSKISELELELKKRNDNDQIVSAMKDDMIRLVGLEKECSRLREENKVLRQNKENVFLLKEKVLSLQEELDGSRSELEKTKQLELDNHDLRARLEKWESVGSSPTSTSNFLARLQKSEVSLMDQTGKLKSELLSARTRVIERERDISRLQAELKQNKDSHEITTANFKRLRRKFLLVSKESEGYKNIINSYESEATVNITDSSSSKIAMLEKLVAEYKDILASHDSDFSSLSGKVQQKESSSNEMFLKAEVNRLEQQVRNLQTQVETYESLKVPEKQRIFHFQSNPVALAQRKQEKDFKTVRDENEWLRSRLQVLEAGTSADVTAEAQKLLQENRGDTVLSLREQVSAAEQKNKRMMEAFKKTSQEFREVVYILTGFKIDMPNPNKFKLSHMYGESPHDFLLFEQTNDGKVDLLETDYSKSIDHLISDFLIKQQSIPLFLSNITLELFYRQTSVLDS